MTRDVPVPDSFMQTLLKPSIDGRFDGQHLEMTTFRIRRTRRELLEWCKTNICTYPVGGGSARPRKWRITSISERSGDGQTKPALHTVVIADDVDAAKFQEAFGEAHMVE